MFKTIPNNPRVKILKGRVNSFKIGFKNALISPKTTPEIIKSVKFAIITLSAKILDAIHRPKVAPKTWNIILVISTIPSELNNAYIIVADISVSGKKD